MRHQVISNPASVEPSEDEQGGVVDDYEEDEESSEESQEENSDGYEENELGQCFFSLFCTALAVLTPIPRTQCSTKLEGTKISKDS